MEQALSKYLMNFNQLLCSSDSLFLGTLVKEELKNNIAVYFLYLEKHVEEIMKKISPFIAQGISEKGLKGALDLNFAITRLHTPLWYDEEMEEIEGSYQDISVPELIKDACTIIGP
ncbi:unnamed protein product [Didymodactylos carnosus]|uniref:Uncharacterized protein n=1 Tax=Didymodactylos carnosus TaxID=1234261 RepID=A0A8S2K694_9BILA|nr:unnamed protein product [Didymodactylos carnosus]CAF3839260.1 unnamed protein product [Didymodactylos carnosus]